MDIFTDSMHFGTLYKYMYPNDRATLRLVCKELRDAVNLNVRRLTNDVVKNSYEPFSMPVFVSKLPNLEIIDTEFSSLESAGFANIFQGALLARKLTSLDLVKYRAVGDLPLERRESRVQVLENSFGTISHNHWHILKRLVIQGLDMTVTMQSMKGLLRLSTLDMLHLIDCRFNFESFNLIQPGSWPVLRHLHLGGSVLVSDCSEGAIRALLHLTGLEELALWHGDITVEGYAQIQPGSWPKLKYLNLDGRGTLGDDPVAAINAFLHLTSLRTWHASGTKWSGECLSQIKPGSWPHIKQLCLLYNDLSDDPVGAVKGLLYLTTVTTLLIDTCSVPGAAISQIKPGDWPRLRQLFLNENDFIDDKEGAKKALLCLTSLDGIVNDFEFNGIDIEGCGWTEEEIGEIRATIRGRMKEGVEKKS